MESKFSYFLFSKKSVIAYGTFLLLMGGFYFSGDKVWGAIFPADLITVTSIEISNVPKDALYVEDTFHPTLTCRASNKKVIDCGTVEYSLDTSSSNPNVALDVRSGALTASRVGDYSIMAKAIPSGKTSPAASLTFRPHSVDLSCVSTSQGLKVSWTPILKNELNTFDALGIFIYEGEMLNDVFSDEPIDKKETVVLVPIASIKKNHMYSIQVEARSAIDAEKTFLYTIGKKDCEY